MAYKNYEELPFTEDFMFGKVMSGKGLCRDVLELLLQKPVGELSDPVSQWAYRYTSEGKPVRLDIYTKDDEAVYDAEMQNLNRQKPENLMIPKRTRFYQSSIDMDFLSKGDSYRKLPEVNILMICTFDPFGRNEAVYEIESACRKNHDMVFDDGIVRYFFNAAYTGDDIPEKLKNFYTYLQTGRPTDDLTDRIENAVRQARKNEVWKGEYMKERLHDEDIREEGRAEGIEVGRLQERANTERAQAKIAELEQQLAELKALLKAKEIS